MLQPTNRLTLIDAMRPPAGFRLESAMAVTFTLDRVCALHRGQDGVLGALLVQGCEFRGVARCTNLQPRPRSVRTIEPCVGDPLSPLLSFQRIYEISK